MHTRVHVARVCRCAYARALLISLPRPFMPWAYHGFCVHSPHMVADVTLADNAGWTPLHECADTDVNLAHRAVLRSCECVRAFVRVHATLSTEVSCRHRLHP